ncbi:MAG: hypothetical protein Fur005_32180 [Roseiflexaceae bacterium]
MRTRRHRQYLGRDFAIAVTLLVFGLALPLAATINNRRVQAIQRQALVRSSVVASQPLPATDPFPLVTIVPAVPVDVTAAATTIATGNVNPVTSIPPSQPPIIPTLAQILPSATPLVGSAPPPAADAGVALSTPAPILMYHYVRSVDASIDPPGYELSVAPDLFATHIAWLAQNGYQGIRLDQMIRCWQGQPICPPKPVVITFDDGYRDAASAALPILRQYGFFATFYIVPNFVDQPGYLTWAEVASLRDAGMEIGSHTLDHVMLTRTAPEEVARQVRESKLVLEQRLGISVSSFCYPVGDYDGYSIEAVRAAGYGNAVTTRWDANYSELLALPRRRVAGGTTAEELGWIVSN